ncbi:MAG: cobyric acid synthase [Dictyoglomi bacterium]|nr:cobyric acid synthase [Dictyoglomota bacterium]
MKKAIGVLGTMSGAGKTTLSLLLIRYMKKFLHLDVVPFKGQNMSLNAKVTPEGYEMSSAQYYQALAAEVIPSPIYNPILLKPGAPTESYMIINGKPAGSIDSKNWVSKDREKLWEIIKANLDTLIKTHDYIVIEGAGSPAEINLKKYDITNMRPIMYTDADGILVADIDRGGSFAQIVGTMELLSPDERNHIKVFVLNKFRGDESLLKEGIDYLYRRYSIPTVVLPYIHHNLPEEDALKRNIPHNQDDITVAVIQTPHMANHDDFDPLIGNVNLIFTTNIRDIEHADVVILPGSRKVVEDLRFVRSMGIDKAIREAWESGAYIIGICGGFQMLTESIVDEEGIEDKPGAYKGLELIPGSTIFRQDKILRLSKGYVMKNIPVIGGIAVLGYEIHHGITETNSPFLRLNGKPDGYYKGHIIGTYLHGLFANNAFSEAFLNMIRNEKGHKDKPFIYTHPIEELDRILEDVKPRIEDIWEHLNM